jgi:type II secretory pathway component GspD/PulD (secretin)
VTKQIRSLVCTLTAAVALTGIAHAQDKNTEPAKATVTIPLRVQVVIARYEGDKKVSSMPYTLSVNAGRGANLRMGVMVPIASTSYTPIATGGPGVNPLTAYQYKDVGTNIDCSTFALDDGRFRLELTVEDSSVDEPARSTPADHPAFRSFRATNSLVLKDGQTAQFTTAVDKISGVVTKVDVSLTVVK